MKAVVIFLGVVVLIVALSAIWPPAWAPDGWRRWTRPVRHRVRRRHYRHFR